MLTILEEKKHFFLLIAIVIFAFVLRLYRINEIPAGFFCDEASYGYDAYSILTTGRDRYGNFMPLVFKSFGDYVPPVFIYSIIPNLLFFGLNEFSVRFTSIVYGILVIIFTYLLAEKVFNDKLVSKMFFRKLSNYSVFLTNKKLFV